MNDKSTVQWEKPELVVLVRGKSEEAVLDHCKTESVGTNPGTNAQHCGHHTEESCATCHDRGGKGLS